MINIISKSYLSSHVTGPQKVVANLIKGLDKIGYPYVVNKSLDSCNRLWIHDDEYAVKQARNLDGVNVLAGPNLSIEIEPKKMVLLQPSQWSKNFCLKYRYNSGPVDVWPTGIDTGKFSPSVLGLDKERVLIYFKERYDQELEKIIDILKQKFISYKLIKYGEYQESEYLYLLHTVKYGIWLGRQESQGIALQEALSCGVPLLVWDVIKVGHWNPQNSRQESFFTNEEKEFLDTTSAPYFSSDCGIIIKSESELVNAVETMEERYQEFDPRTYVLNNLSLEGQALALLKLFEKHFGLSVESGYSEKLLNNKDWVNNYFIYKIFIQVKKMLRKILSN